jgi:ribosomal protein S6--L-glutamate ligase
VVVKQLEGTQGDGVVLATTEYDAKKTLEIFENQKSRVLFQEFIAESNGSDIRAFIIDGKVKGAMKRQAKTGEFRSNLHLGGSAALLELSEAETKLAVKAARTLKLPVCGVDLLQSNRGPLLLEVNSTPGLEGIEKTTTKNLASAIITFIERNYSS